MTHNKKKYPKIHFENLTSEWEQKTLNKLAEINPKSELPNQFEYVDLESVVGTSLIFHRTEYKDTAPSRAQRLAKHGDVFYQTVRPYQKNNFLFDLPYDNFVFSTGYAQLRPNVDSNFLLNRIQEEKFVARVLNRSTGTSYPSINTKDLSEIEVGVPSNQEEQMKIGNLFKNIDELIELNQHALDLLKQRKKAFLQKMLPRKGQQSPDIRFNGFSDEWKEDVLGSYLKIPEKKTATVKKIDDLITLKLNLEGMFGGSNRTTLKLGSTKYYERRAGQFLYGKQNFFNGSMGIIPPELDKNATSGDVPALDIINVDSNFLFTYVSRSEYWKSKEAYSSGTGSKRIHEKTLQKFEIRVPSLEEQEKIGNFFKELDNSITLQEEKLESLKQMKKAFLQKMFV